MDRTALRSTAGELLAMGLAMEAAAGAFRGRPCQLAIDREWVPIVVKVGRGMGLWVGLCDDGTDKVKVEFSRPLITR
jgi:hypothetical protein